MVELKKQLAENKSISQDILISSLASSEDRKEVELIDEFMKLALVAVITYLHKAKSLNVIFEETSVLENQNLWKVCPKHALVRAYPYFAKILQNLILAGDLQFSKNNYTWTQ